MDVKDELERVLGKKLLHPELMKELIEQVEDLIAEGVDTALNEELICRDKNMPKDLFSDWDEENPWKDYFEGEDDNEI